MAANNHGSTTIVTSPAPRATWRAVLEASPEATVFHTPEWLDACTSAGGLVDVSRLYEAPDGTQLVLPAVRRAAPWSRFATTWSMPTFWGYGGVLTHGSVSERNIASVLAVDPLSKDGRLVVKPGPHATDAWHAARPRARRSHCVHVLDLRRGYGELWSNAFSSSTRNKIRKAERRGVELEWGVGGEFLNEFWGIFIRWSAQRAEARGLPVWLVLALARRREPLVNFRAMAEHLGDRFRILLARVDGEPVAATIVLTHGTHAHYWRSTSDQAAMGQRYANYLVMARLIEDVAERGHEYLDMGESGGVESLAEYKEKFGARPMFYDELRFEPQLVTSTLDARERMTHAATEVALAAARRLQS